MSRALYSSSSPWWRSEEGHGSKLPCGGIYEWLIADDNSTSGPSGSTQSSSSQVRSDNRIQGLTVIVKVGAAQSPEHPITLDNSLLAPGPPAIHHQTDYPIKPLLTTGRSAIQSSAFTDQSLLCQRYTTSRFLDFTPPVTCTGSLHDLTINHGKLKLDRYEHAMPVRVCPGNQAHSRTKCSWTGSITYTFDHGALHAAVSKDSCSASYPSCNVLFSMFDQ